MMKESHQFLILAGVASIGVLLVIREGRRSLEASGLETWAVGSDEAPGWLTRYYMYKSGNPNVGYMGAVPAGSVWDWDPMNTGGSSGGGRWGVLPRAFDWNPIQGRWGLFGSAA